MPEPTKPTCQVCDAQTDAFLCESCTLALEKTIAELPSQISDLEITATRQAKVDNPPRPDAPQTEDHISDAEKRMVPAYLRSKDGYATLPTTQLPFAPVTARLHSQATREVERWARRISKRLRAKLVLPPYAGPVHPDCEHDSCRTMLAERSNNAQAKTTRLCTWLVANIDAIRGDDAAGEIHFRLTALSEAIEDSVDRRDSAVFAGRCTERVIAVTSANDVDVLIPTVDEECGTELYAELGDATIECRACGATYDVTERRAELRAAVSNVHARAHTIANGLTTLDEPVKPETLRKWIQRDREIMDQLRAGERKQPPAYPMIVEVDTDPDGHPLYRVGDVQARIEVMRSRSEHRRAG